MTQPVVQTRQLRCHFRRGHQWLAAVDGVDLDILPGEVLGLVGESGSGKSTLGRLIAGLQARGGGDLLLQGVPRQRHAGKRDFRRFAKVVQMVFQDSYSSLNPRLPIIDSLSEPLLMQGVSRRDARQVSQDWLERVGLPVTAGMRYPHELSGGQRQRVGIARAFSVEPDLVICDEAVSALDVSVQAQILALLQEIQREKGTAMLFISHDLAVVRYLADRVAVMYQGEIVELGEVDQVYDHPGHPYTRALLALHLETDRKLGGVPLLVRSGGLKTAVPLCSDRGCRYALRCPYQQPGCLATPPSLRQGSQRSRVACHRLGELDLSGPGVSNYSGDPA